MRKIPAIMIRPLLLLGLFAASQAAAAQDYIYCVVQDTGTNQNYYSNIFPGSYADSQGYQQAHMEFVNGRASLSNDASSFCYYGDSVDQAESDKQMKMQTDRYNSYQVYDTLWSGG